MGRRRASGGVIGQEEHMRKGTAFALAAILALSVGHAMGATHAPRPAPAMCADVLRSGSRRKSPRAANAWSTRIFRVSRSRSPQWKRRAASFRTSLDCPANSSAALPTTISSSSKWRPRFPRSTTRRSRAYCGSRRSPPPRSASSWICRRRRPSARSRASSTQARRDFASADLRGEIAPRGYAFRDYADVPGAIDAARIAVSFERGKISVAVSGAG